MLQFCATALDYTRGLDQAGFLADRMRYDATLRNIELIGEAATHVPAALRVLAPGIPWREVVGTRNRLAHAYLGIDVDTIWDIVSGELPLLREDSRRCWSGSDRRAWPSVPHSLLEHQTVLHQQGAVNARPKRLKALSFPSCPKLAGTFSAIRSAANLGW